MDELSSKQNNTITDLLLVMVLGIVLFLPYLGAVHLFDWDEINFAESAREMLLTKDFFRVQINFKPFWEKPPLFIWIQAASMTLFGVNEFAARLPNVLVGIATLLVILSIGKKYFSREFGWWWVLVYAGSFLPHLYFKSGIIDPLFNLFIFLGIYSLAQGAASPKFSRERIMHVFYAGVYIGFGVLTKGPVALLVAILCIFVYCVIERSIAIVGWKEILLFSLPVFVIAFAWFGVETIKNGPWFLQEFLVYQVRLFQTKDAGHGGPFFYHWLVLYIGCFPASVFIFKSFLNRKEDTYQQQNLKRWFVISLFVVLVLFSIVKTKIVHYSSFCYFPLSFLAAYGIAKLEAKSIRLPAILRWQIGILGGLIGLLIFAFPLVLLKLPNLFPLFNEYVKDKFALANLNAVVHWSGFESLPGLIYLLILILLLSLSMQFRFRIIGLFVATALLISTTIYLIVPRVEKYTQGALIAFFESLQGKDVYAEVYGFKSYAHLFYTRKKPEADTLSIHQETLLHGAIDKDVYFVSKITNTNLNQEPGLQRLGEKNGFVFYFRKKSPTKPQ